MHVIKPFSLRGIKKGRINLRINNFEFSLGREWGHFISVLGRFYLSKNMGKGSFWLGKGADTDSRQERKAHLTVIKEENRYEVSEIYMKHLEDESEENNIGNQQEKRYLAVEEEDGEEPRGSNMDRVRES